jgi:hypothetical protein
LQNIDPIYFLQPIITILFSVALVVYWHYKRRLTKAALVYSLLAYAGAIVTKVVFQDATYTGFQAAVAGNPFALGAYFGLQTSVLEVGGAFLVAAWASKRGKMNVEDAEGYGLSLALWENAGLIGVLGLLSLAAIYMTLAGGTGAESLSALLSNRPELFYPPFQALPLIAWALLERVTSLLIHLSFGYLALLAACLHQRKYLILGLPMGLIDFFVPFATNANLSVFEISLFLIAVGCLAIALYFTKGIRNHQA